MDQAYTNSKIVHDVINTSSSKQKFSFPQTKRFTNIKTSNCLTPFYELPSTKSTRKAAFGYGNKSNYFGDSQKSQPGPGGYKLRTSFEQDKEKKKGYTFSVGRDNLKYGQIAINSVNPGPGTYEGDDGPASKYSIKFSMGMRTKSQLQLNQNKINPGPGEYEFPQMSKTGYYSISKIPGTLACTFSPPNSKRFKNLTFESLAKLPGPGYYEQEGINPKGVYRNQKFKTAYGGKFSIGNRFFYRHQQNLSPGPGQYRLYSTFGDIDFPPIPKKSMNKSQSQSQQKFNTPKQQVAEQKQEPNKIIQQEPLQKE